MLVDVQDVRGEAAVEEAEDRAPSAKITLHSPAGSEEAAFDCTPYMWGIFQIVHRPASPHLRSRENIQVPSTLLELFSIRGH